MLKQVYKIFKNKTIIIPILLVLLVLIVMLLITVFSQKSNTTLSTQTIPKILWIYWDTEELPHTIKLIKEHNRDKLTDWDVRYLNINTLKNYIPESAYDPKYHNLVSANKSDWIRLYIIYTYGGLWLDAGIIINSYTELNSIYNTSVVKGSQMTVFKTIKKDGTFNHVSGVELPLVIDSWFIMAPQGSQIIKAWLNEFSHAIQIGFLNYKQKIIKDGTDISKIHSASPEDTYLMVHMCIQNVLQKQQPNLPPILILDSSSSMFKLQNICKWKDECIADKLNNDPESKNLPFIKLTNSNRTQNIDKYFA